MGTITVKAARINRGLRQKDMAELMGKSRQTIVSWETGRSKMGIPEFKAWCSICNIPEDSVVLPNFMPKS